MHVLQGRADPAAPPVAALPLERRRGRAAQTAQRRPARHLLLQAGPQDAGPFPLRAEGNGDADVRAGEQAALPDRRVLHAGVGPRGAVLRVRRARDREGVQLPRDDRAAADGTLLNKAPRPAPPRGSRPEALRRTVPRKTTPRTVRRNKLPALQLSKQLHPN